MADEPKANDDTTAKPDWVWVPNASYGPFTFGTHRSRVPYVGTLIEQDDMGPTDEIAFYESERGDIDLTFWNNYLTGVEARDTFVVNDTELIGAHFNDVRHVVDERPAFDNLVVILTAEFDDLDMTWYMTPDWQITSVSVGVDPDTMPDGT